MSERSCFKCEGRTSSIQIKRLECDKQEWRCHCCCSDINCCDVNNPLKKKKRDREDDEIAPEVVKRKLQFNLSTFDVAPFNDTLMRIGLNNVENPKIGVGSYISKESLLELLSNK